MIHLYNHTQHPDGPIKDILTFAARVMGVKGDVHVKLTRSQYAKPGGWAGRTFPYLGFMKGTTNREGRNGKLVSDLPGFVVLSLPNKAPNKHNPKTDWLTACEWFVHTALHEMAHIFQYRTNRLGKLLSAEKAYARKRQEAHDKRPVEVDAENLIYDVMQDWQRDLRRQDLAIGLAIAIEERLK
jgi:hypothetical protein